MRRSKTRRGVFRVNEERNAIGSSTAIVKLSIVGVVQEENGGCNNWRPINDVHLAQSIINRRHGAADKSEPHIVQRRKKREHGHVVRYPKRPPLRPDRRKTARLPNR